MFRMRIAAHVLVLALAALPGYASADCTPGQPDSTGMAVAIDPPARARQAKAIRAMKLENLQYSVLGPVTLAQGDTGIVLPADVTYRTEGASADDLLPLLADVLLANGNESL